ncbi:uncharacterized protein TNCV_1607731 [Trichonephila clavipes]|nr:uncharacterized protein TNCV_1607731 [Trichonephila clavipes]
MILRLVDNEKKEAEKSTRLENENDQFRLRECVVENGEDFVPSLTGEGTDNGNLVKIRDCEVMEAQLSNEESAPLIRGTENGASDEASDQEEASIQLVPVSHDLCIDTIEPLPIAPARGKHILPDMSMSPRCHQTVTERLKRKPKKGDIKWTSECPEFFRQLEGNLSTNSVLYAPDFTKRFFFNPKQFYLFFFLDLQRTELFLHQKKFSLEEGEVVANVVPGPQKRIVLLPEEVGEKGFLEFRSPTFRIDSSGKGMRRTGFEGPDWRQKA